jgi:hypothetical protein
MDKQIEIKFNQLSEAEQKRIKRVASEIQRFGVEMFWQDNGELKQNHPLRRGYERVE